LGCVTPLPGLATRPQACSGFRRGITPHAATGPPASHSHTGTSGPRSRRARPRVPLVPNRMPAAAPPYKDTTGSTLLRASPAPGLLLARLPGPATRPQARSQAPATRERPSPGFPRVEPVYRRGL